ncbi:hypothetical protein TPAR_07753 [Tolypocladium paradoxum]|uniref:Uncharacterized protein n=1 Tax=Tolypocladium paradoxum TaxID=94208 RepID=A0A2S4KPE4_9HYPO|nr:hypothetical protein TPAR_07753 [Tolypocladium paradoxum]
MQLVKLLALAAVASVASTAPTSDYDSAPVEASVLAERGCPYGGQVQCLQIQNQLCASGCPSRPRQKMPCLMECMSSSTIACLRLGC